MVNSVQEGMPGFVSAGYLDAIAAETSVTAAELCMAKMWRRVAGGYEILDREMLDHAVDANRRQEEAFAHCAATGGHEPDDEDPRICGKCWNLIDPK